MALTVVATPLGNLQDITLAGLETLKIADIVVGEERSEASRLLKALGITGKTIELLNEHSKKEDIQFLLNLCREKNVALISDCGTPGFCDPGHQLVAACRSAGISMTTRPGPASIAAILSLSSERIDHFVFQGFLPADREFRTEHLKKLQKESRAIIFMETPYRLKKWLEDLALSFPKRKALLALNLTQETEWIYEGHISDILKKLPVEKAEPILLLYQQTESLQESPKKWQKKKTIPKFRKK